MGRNFEAVPTTNKANLLVLVVLMVREDLHMDQGVIHMGLVDPPTTTPEVPHKALEGLLKALEVLLKALLVLLKPLGVLLKDKVLLHMDPQILVPTAKLARERWM